MLVIYTATATKKKDHNDSRTHHAAKSLAGPEGPDDQRDVQVRVNPPALIATLQTAHIVLQLALVKLVDQVSLENTKQKKEHQNTLHTPLITKKTVQQTPTHSQ